MMMIKLRSECFFSTSFENAKYFCIPLLIAKKDTNMRKAVTQASKLISTLRFLASNQWNLYIV